MNRKWLFDQFKLKALRLLEKRDKSGAELARELESPERFLPIGKN